MAQQTRLGKTATTVHIDEDGRTQIIYHDTPVVAFDNNIIRLDSGGWRTPTTKTRMNQSSNQFGLGFSVYQKNYKWYVSCNDSRVLPFSDGMMFSRIPWGLMKTPEWRTGRGLLIPNCKVR